MAAPKKLEAHNSDPQQRIYCEQVVQSFVVTILNFLKHVADIKFKTGISFFQKQ